MHRELTGAGQELWLASIHGEACYMLQRSSVADQVGEERIFRTVGEAYRTIRTASAPTAPTGAGEGN